MGGTKRMRPGALKRISFVAIGSALLSLIQIGSAEATHSLPYFPEPWANYEFISYDIDPSIPTGNWRERLAAGRDEWNSEASGADPWLSFNAVRAVPSVDSVCTYDREMGIRQEQLNDVEDGNGTWGGVVRTCRTAAGGRTLRAILSIDTDAATADTWYTGTSTTIPNDTADLWAYFSHEFGHAVGWGPHWPNDASNCPLTTQRKTMCAILPNNSDVVPMRTLGASEITMFNNAYPHSH